MNSVVSTDNHGKLKSVIRLLRPRQWTKNLIAVLPLLFSGNLFKPDLLIHVALCVAGLCLLSGSIYVFNDILDVEADRKHPTKCKRPIAAGAIQVSEAWILGLICLGLSFIFAYSVRPALCLVFLAYLLLQMAYTHRLKHRVVLDIFCIAAGFVLRALAGGASAHVPLSSWFLLCTSLGALYLGLEKRRQELAVLGESAASHRKVLGKYSDRLVDRMEAVILPSLVTAYAFYSFQSQYGQWMMITVPIVLYGLFRYQVLSLQDNQTQSPEEVLLRDRPIQLTVALWVVASASVVYGWLPAFCRAAVGLADGFRVSF